MVDVPDTYPNLIYIPRAIFDFDVRPSAKGAPHQVKQGLQVPRSKN